MKRVKKYGLWAFIIVGVAVLYINVGVLIAYSLDASVEQTTTTYMVRRLIDWWDLVPPTPHTVWTHTGWNSGLVLIWPIAAGTIVAGNIGYTLIVISAAVWTAAKWLFFGGIWEWLGIIKG